MSNNAANKATTADVDQTDPDALAARIRTQMASLPPASAKVAQLILDDPRVVARSTIQELVTVVGTSEASIVRAARSLGFKGFPDLRYALAAAYGQQRSDHQITGDIDAADPIGDVIQKISSAEQQAIRETAAHIDGAEIERIADAIVAGRKMVVYGAGASGLVAADLSHKLLRVGLTCHASPDSHLALTEAALLTNSDLAIAVSHSGETKEAIAFLAAAQEAGAITVALVGAQDATVTKYANHVVYAAGRDSVFRPAALSSRISQFMAIDCLFVAVAQRTYETTTASVATTREVLSTYRR